MSNQTLEQSIKLLSFDLDDTLWPCLPTIKKAEDALYHWLAEHVPQITGLYDIEQLHEKRRALFKQHPEMTHDLSALRLHSFELLAAELSLGSEWIQPAFDVFFQARQQVSLFDDVQPVLDELKKEYRLVSLTNGNADAVETGIDQWFDFSLNSASVGKMKSEPEIYRQVQQRANIEAGQMVHIGDHPSQDVSGAQSAQVFAVWLNRENAVWPLANSQPDAEINSLHELPALLKRL